MRILVIPDIHENCDFLKYIFLVEDRESFDKIVLLGDYFDPPPYQDTCFTRLREVAQMVRDLKHALGERLHLLCGNHDLPYYALGYTRGASINCSKEIIGHWLRTTTLPRAQIINDIWDDTFWRNLEGAVFLDGWLFSHAGVHSALWMHLGSASAQRYSAFQYAWENAFINIDHEFDNPIFSIGRARGGLSLFGGPLWLDWEDEFEDDLDVPQVVGHTRCPRNEKKGRSYCIDFAQTTYAILDNGAIQLKEL